MRLSVEDAVAKALDSNRDLRAAARLLDEAEGHREGAGILPNPELEFGGGPGLYARTLLSLAFGIRRHFGQRLVAPVLPPSIKQVTLEMDLDDRPMRWDLSPSA